MIAGQLEIQLIADIARLANDMSKAQQTVTSTMGHIDRAVGIATKALGVLGVGLSVNAFANFVKGAINAQDELAKMSQRVGVSVQALAGFDHAASMSGASLMTVEKGLKTVSQQMLDAQRGLKASQENFAALGISVVDSTGALRSADSVMIEVADQFAKMRDGTEKTALATKLFGRAGLELIPMLNEGSAGLAALVAEGQRLNPVTAESARQSEIYNDNMERLSKTAGALGVQFVNSLLPTISELSERMVEFTRSDEFDTLLKRIGITAEALAAIFMTRLVVSLTASAAGFVSSTAQSIAYQAALARMAGVSSAAAAGQAALATATNGARTALMLVGGPAGALVLVTAGLALMISKMETAAERTDRLRSSMRLLEAEELQRNIRTMEANVRNIEATIARYERMNQNVGDTARLLATQRQRLEEENATLGEYRTQLEGVINGTIRLNEETGGADGLTPTTIEQTNALRDLNAIYVQTAIALSQTEAGYVRLMGFTDEVTTRKTRLAAGTRGVAVDMDTLAIAMEGVSATSTAVSKQAQREWMEFRNSFSDSLADMMMDGGNVFDNIAKSFERMLYKMAGDLIASGILSFLTDGKSGGFSLANTLASSGTTGTLVSAGLSKFAPDLASSLGISSVGGGGSYLAKVATGGKGVITNAEFEQLMGGKSTSTGLNVTDLKNIGLSIGAGIAGSWAGTAAGESLFDKQAESSWGATAGGVIGAIWGPLGAFIGSALGGMVDAAFGGDGMKRQNAGFVAGYTPGLKDEYNLGQHEFASGLKVSIFGRRTDPYAATDIVQVFDEVDRSFTDLVKALGGDLKVSALRGLDEEANPGSYGNFFGVGGNGTTQGDILAQVNSYVDQLADQVTGLDQTLIDSVRAATSAEESLALLTAALSEKSAADERARIALGNYTEAEKRLMDSKASLIHQYETEEQRLESAKKQIREAFGEFGVAVPNSVEELRTLIATIDPLTERGGAAITALEGLSGAIDLVAANAARHAQNIAALSYSDAIRYQNANPRAGLITSFAEKVRLDTMLEQIGPPSPPPPLPVPVMTINNPVGPPSPAGSQPATALDIRGLNTTLQVIAVNTSKTARVLDRALKEGEGAFAVTSV